MWDACAFASNEINLKKKKVKKKEKKVHLLLYRLQEAFGRQRA